MIAIAAWTSHLSFRYAQISIGVKVLKGRKTASVFTVFTVSILAASVTLPVYVRIPVVWRNAVVAY